MALLVSSFITSCTTDDLDPTLEQSKDAANGITKVDNLYAVIKGAYNRLTSAGYYGRDYIVNGEVRTPNTFSNGNSGRFTTQSSFAYLPTSGYMWDNAYRVISSANVIINTDLASLEGDQETGQHLQGQAYALRALAHFDLLKEYGQMHVGGDLGVPVVSTYLSGASSEEELFSSRNTVDEVKTQIFADLNKAYELMSETGEKVFMTKTAAKALEARVALYFGMYTEARDAAKAVIDLGAYSVLDANNFVSSWAGKQAGNSIFELAFGTSDNNGINGLGYIYRGDSYGDVQVCDEIAGLFEEGDVRGMGGILGTEEIGGNTLLRNMGKYPDNNGNNNIPLIRYEEVILTYAEALLETGGDALSYLNMIAENRGASAYTEATKENILNERRKELMFEGFYFHDLLRNGKGIQKLYPQQLITEDVAYGDYRLAWPIPIQEIDANSNIQQNPGY